MMIEDTRPQPVAVVGMACKFPGADSLDEFWNILETGRSMVGMPPPDRFPVEDHSRSTAKSVFFGNYLDDVTSFDNQFFHKSSREAASMDPQQRLLLEVAYQALESAGFFGPREQELDVGCFVGACASDYNDNVASHPPNAYSTLGSLRAFLTGRISHNFGFSGPSVTYDTACSSSAVAIDAACKAVLHGDCKVALAGGVSVFTSPHFFQNLAAASFLSPTGATKSFDAGADGYCRGEGVGLVVLKPLSQAISDDDNILGTILATSVRQSSNTVPITVPYSPSQTALYHKVLGTAGITADEISYLEAHGTGTPVGDVQEFESIKRTFGDGKRQQPLHFASVKGNIGHTEGASGVAGLIKVLLMMRKRQIPKQANYVRANPKINLIPGQLAIPTQTIPWEADVRFAIVNNYGAAGSMAAMVVREAPTEHTLQALQHRGLPRYPILVSANNDKSLFQNSQKSREFIASSRLLSSSTNVLADLAFNLSETQNLELPNIFTTTVSSITDLDRQLTAIVTSPDSSPRRTNSKPKPVVLVFGGQTARCASISRETYDSSSLLRKHLDECDGVLQTLGHRGIYPGLFTTDSIGDVVDLQARQFAVQYASAQTWIACGLKVECVLGHSFGQLAALTVSGVFSLVDGLKLVLGRGLLMRNNWGPEKGSMIALDADLETTTRLLSVVREKHSYTEIEVACYNGPKSHVLVGSANEIEAVAVAARASAVRYKILDMTHGFHSRFCDAITSDLEQIALGLTYNEPKIPIETCSSGESWPAATPKLIAEHTRTAVYFEDAVKRIESRKGPCTWLEAGSNSSVIGIARRVFTNADSIAHLHCPINLVQKDAMGALADTTATLWRHGHRVQFWPFHRIQRREYSPLQLPPYQFEKKRHWLDFKLGTENPFDNRQEEPVVRVPEPDPVFIKFKGFQDSSQRRADFTIDPRSDEWQALVKGHSVLDEPLCPAPLYMELVFQASKDLAKTKNINCATFPRFDGLEITKALGASQDKIVTLTLNQSDTTSSKFEFVFQSQGRNSTQSEKRSVHATGSVEMISPQESRQISVDLDRLGKLIKYRKLEEIAAEPGAEAAQGSLVYKVFSRVVTYHDFYKGVRNIASSAGTAMASVQLPEPQPAAIQGMLLNPVAIDNFLQVSGLQSNCLGQCPSDEVFVCTLVERVQFAPDYGDFQSNVWEVFAMSTAMGEKECTNDVFVRDQATGKLVFAVFGAVFSRVRISSLAKAISRANKSEKDMLATTSGASLDILHSPSRQDAVANPRSKPEATGRSAGIDLSPARVTRQAQASFEASHKESQSKVSGLENKLQTLLSRITDIPSQEFQGQVKLEDLGVDSLMATEIVSEVQEVFNITIPQHHLPELSMFSSLLDYLSTHGVGYQTSRDSNTQPTPPTQSLQIDVTTSHVPQVPQDLRLDANSKSPNTDLILRLADLLGSHLECPSSSFERSTVLADRGLDSLLCMELMSDIEQLFGVSVDLSALTMDSVFGELADILSNAVTGAPASSSSASSVAHQSSLATIPTPDYEGFDHQHATGAFSTLVGAADDFESIKDKLDSLVEEHKFAGFYKSVHPRQSQLVLAYTVEAFAELGIDLTRLNTGDEIPQLLVLPKHHQLRRALYEVLRDGKVANYDGLRYLRSEEALESTPSSVLYTNIVKDFPHHAKEHELLNLCGAELARLLTGEKDPLSLLFGSKASRTLLEDVYSTSPMYIIMSQLLVTFLEKALSKCLPGPDGKFHIIEVGAGTGSTTKWVIERLVQRGIPIEYTFTDFSSSLVSAGKRKFSKFDCIKYATLDIEKEPPAHLQGQFDIVLSTNCIHATSNLSNSLSNINKLLRPHGFVSLVEFTKRFFWFDIVFGILEGWWLFNDGRQYVLTPPEHWGKDMLASGFKHVSWTGGSTPESEAVRIITGFKQPVTEPNSHLSIPQQRKGGIETVVFEHTDKKLPLKADIHYPSPAQASAHDTWTAGTVLPLP